MKRAELCIKMMPLHWGRNGSNAERGAVEREARILVYSSIATEGSAIEVQLKSRVFERTTPLSRTLRVVSE